MHDGDKIQLALLDFIEDFISKDKTEERMYLDYQIKNNALGEWNEVEQRYNKFYGKIKHDGKIISLSDNRDEALKQISEAFNMNEEEFNMYNKMHRTYSHVVEARAKKELGKHYNEIYEMIAELKDFSTRGYLLSKDDLKRVESVMDIASDGVHSNIAKKHIQGTRKVIDMLRSGNYDISSYINDMDLIGQTAIYKILRGNQDNSTDLYKAVLKDIDKYISRGNFDEFYKEKNAKAVFDELSGIRNTGMTHRYATDLINTSIELREINPSEFIERTGRFGENLNVDTLIEMKRKQKYYAQNVDLFVDNMIESAISAKHGLTLGGLEGSKIFINSILANNSEKMNEKIIGMYDDIFINNNTNKLVNLMENIAYYKQSFDERSQVLEDVVSELEGRNLNKERLFKYFDIGEENFRNVYRNIIPQSDINQYVYFGQKYGNLTRKIETDMFEHLMDKYYVNPEEFEIFRGLNLFGELLIQNDPGLEYDVSSAVEALEKYRHNGNIEELLKNKEIRNLREQAFTSLGTAASISNVGKLRKYLGAFVANQEYKTLRDEFEEIISNSKNFSELLKKHNIDEVFDFELNVKNKFRKQVNENGLKELEYFQKRYNKLSTNFYTDVMRKSNNPIEVFSSLLNKNNTLYSKSGKSGEESLRLLRDMKLNGVGSANESSLSESLRKIDSDVNKMKSELFKTFSEYDSDFKDFFVDDLVTEATNEESPLAYLSKAIDNTLFDKYKADIPELKLGNDKMVTLKIANKLSQEEEQLKKWGKLYQVNLKDYIQGHMFNFVKNDGRNFIINDTSLFYRNGVFNKRRFDKITKFARNNNLYFSERISRMIFNMNPEIKDRYLSAEERRRLSIDLLNAKKYLGENLSKENILKRMSLKFDSNLASTVAVEKYLQNNPIDFEPGTIKKYKDSLNKNLRMILEDFHSVDSDIYNDYVNPNYVRMAKTYTDANREYRSLQSINELNNARYAKTQRALKRLISNQRQWFEKNNIDIDLFSKMASVEMLNRDKVTNTELRNAFLDVAKLIGGSEVTDDLKYNKVIDDAVDVISQNKKVGAAAMLASGIFMAGKIIKPFFEKNDGVYTLSNNAKNLSDKQIMDTLNFGNGLKTDMINEELKGIINPKTYISVNKKNRF